MRILKSKWFHRYAKKEGITDESPIDAITRAENSQIDADLGSGVIKQRVARPGQGRSGGYRTIIFFRRADKAFFEYGFSKNHRANITADEAMQFKKAAKRVLALTDKHLAELLKRDDFVEVENE